MKNLTRSLILASALSLAGCTAIKIALVQAFVDQIVTGTWIKDGATQQDYYDANWKCQQATSRFDPNQGTLFDLKAYYNCMIQAGWRLQTMDVSPLVK